MIKVPCFDLNAFADEITRLLDDEKHYEKVSRDALDWAKGWDWAERARNTSAAMDLLFE
jgi:hypothetical protein